jgi:N utilization substance protein A
MDDESRSMEVIVPDDQLSLAIGKSGQNVRLAARLTGWKIDVKSDAMTEGRRGKEYESLLQISDMDETTAEMLYKEGFKDIKILASADPELISLLPTIQGLSKEKLSLWIDEAAKILARENNGHDA